MHILAFIQDQYGKRIVQQISEKAPQGWIIDTITAPKALPAVVDEPEEYLPSAIPQVDLLIIMTESSGAAQLTTALAKISRAKAVIAPIDNSAWLLPGLKNQLKRELAQIGVASVFPKTFCTLTESTVGFGQNSEYYDDVYVSTFARHFGKPKLKLQVDPQTSVITQVSVERGAPCGSTHFAADKLVGMTLDEVVPQAGLIDHYYPCHASMQQENIDEGLFEPLMNVSGYVMNEALERKNSLYRIED
jgi:hypothetical protein